MSPTASVVPLVASSSVSNSIAAPAKVARLASLDAFRGAIMMFLVSGGLGLSVIARNYPDSALWKFLAYNTSHAIWVGGGAWDMIQPSFMFMVGVAMPFSYASRQAQGDSFARQFSHAVRRVLVLIAIGVMIASRPADHTVFMFTNVLAQIGLGYLALFALIGRGWRVQTAVLAILAIGYFALFAAWRAPSADFNYLNVGVRPRELKEVVLTGAFAHWSSQSNVAAVFDRWFLNLFPTAKPFVFNAGGYQTLNFVPSLVTMLLGLMAGERLRRPDSARAKLTWLVGVGAGCIAVGLVAGFTICPLVKRIWTPSWAIYSGGIVLCVLAAFYYVVDVRGWRRWTFPLVVLGMNSIAIYLLDIFARGWMGETLERHLGSGMFQGTFGVLWRDLGVLLSFWLVGWWLYRRKIFLRI